MNAIANRPATAQNGAAAARVTSNRPTRILIVSHDFYPTLGGIETAGMTLANGLAKRGYDVTVATDTEGGPDDGLPFRIVRLPNEIERVRIIMQADLVWQNHVNLRLAWPVFIVRRPMVVAHHIWLDVSGVQGLRFGFIKRIACRFGQNVYVSEALRNDVGLPGPIIPNTFDPETFRVTPGVERDRDVAFLGRLVPVKGADILVNALGILAAQGLPLKATLIGEGPEEAALKELADLRSVSSHTEFAGPMRSHALAHLLNRHKIVVVPSRWEEPFGIVALEALACGCVVTVAESGALPEVVGPCGPTFAKNDPASLAARLRELIENPALLQRHRDAIPAHLAQFGEEAHIDSCEAVIRQTLAVWRTGKSSVQPA